MDSLVSIVTRLWAGQSAAQFRAGARDFSLLQNIHPASYSVGRGLFSCWLSTQGVKLTSHFHLVPRLRMSGAMYLPFYMPPWHVQAQLYLPLCSKQKILCNIITHSYTGSSFHFYGRRQNITHFHVWFCCTNFSRL
jgi:hypothetical protein